MATTNAIMPIPPIQCVSALQNKILFGKDSISFKMDEPVVVKPDMVSNNASVKFEIELLKRYGKIPNNEINIHDKVTIKKLSFMLGLSGRFELVP
jgi:hypothetical protein